MKLLLILLPLWAFSQSYDLSFESYPVLAKGRVKPFIVYAEETLSFISKSEKHKDMNASEVVFHLLFDTKKASRISVSVLVEHNSVKELLGIPASENSAPAVALIDSKDLIAREARKIKGSTPVKKELERVWARINLYERILSGEDMHLFSKSEWRQLSSYDTKALAYDEFKKSRSRYIQENGDDYQVELLYRKIAPFTWSILLALLSIFSLVLIRSKPIGVLLTGLTLLVQIIGVGFRVYISNRAPITNMYETVMFSGIGAVVLAFGLYYFKRDRIYLLAGLGYNIMCLFMMRFAHGMLDPSIGPLVPVLRDNFWLSTHVTTVILSYAAMALSWILANITLIKRRFFALTNKEYREYEKLITNAVKVGVVLLSAGIILGGVWADYSWGRFWGWDPKETWSLIVLLFYVALLHGKFTNWLTTHRFIVSVAAGFMTVMMAWFGVNYILATGLHSYGFSEGGAIFLGSFFLAQTVLLIITATGVSKESK